MLRIQLVYPKLCFFCLSFFSLLSVAAIGWTGGIVWISRRARTQSIAENRWYSLIYAFQSWGKRLGISLVQRRYGHRRWRSYHTRGITVAWRWTVTWVIRAVLVWFLKTLDWLLTIWALSWNGWLVYGRSSGHCIGIYHSEFHLHRPCSISQAFWSCS